MPDSTSPHHPYSGRLFLPVFSLALLCLSVTTLVVSGPLWAHEDSAYNNDSWTGLRLNEWMTPLDDSLRLSELSIPGTHDTAAYSFGGQAVITQSMTIGDQLEAGIRVLDLRIGQGPAIPNCDETEIYMFHAVVCQGTLFRDAVQEMKDFLAAHPGETIIARVQEDYKVFPLNLSEVTEILGSSYYDGDEVNPTLGDIRGKIYVLSSLSGDAIGPSKWEASNQIIQDKYSLGGLTDLAVKWRDYVIPQFKNSDAIRVNNPSVPSWKSATAYQKHAIVSHNGSVWVTTVAVEVDSAKPDNVPVPGVDGTWLRNDDAIYVNHLSAAEGNFPYFYASGHSSWETSAPRLATGKLRGFAAVADLTECTDFDWCIDEFPSLNCIDFFGIDGSRTCSVFYEGINTLARNYLSNRVKDRAGIVMIDFPGSSLIKAIVNLNPYKIPLVAEIGGPGCEPQAPGEDPPFDSEGSDVYLMPGPGTKGSGLTFRWDTNGDGVWDTPFQKWFSPPPMVSLEDEGILSVGLEVKDQFGEYDTDDCVIEFQNRAPFFVSLQGTTSINEGQTASVVGLIGDTGLDVQIVEIDWDGDGLKDASRRLPLSSERCPSQGYCTPFDQQFLFADNPGGTNTAYNRRITIIDEDGASSVHDQIIHVRNVAPSITSNELANLTKGEVITPDSYIDVGTTVGLYVEFTDPGDDTWTAAVGWGDGYVQANLDANDMGIAVEHTFTLEGPRQVIFEVSDDDFGQTRGYSVPFNVGEPPPPPVDLDPPVAVAGGPYTAVEGLRIYPDASASTVDSSRTPYFRWDFDGDGSWDTERTTNPASASWRGPDELNPDDYSGTLRVEVWDGSTAAIGETTVTFTNLDPLPAGQPSKFSLIENEMFVLTVTIDDPGDDTWTVHVDWDGDGNDDESVDLPHGVEKVSFTHRYPDEPEGEDSEYLIGVTAVDEDGGRGFDQPYVNVYNVSPTLNLEEVINSDWELLGVLSDQNLITAARLGVPVRLFATWSDPGPDDTHEVVIDWGDGNTTMISNPEELIDETHVYSTLGPREVTVTITDDDGGEDSDSWPVFDVIDLIFQDGFEE
jgi:1-phosphatidylinositol phosphodiesterase